MSEPTTHGYVCVNCGRLSADVADFSDECRPGWTHSVLVKVTTPFVTGPAQSAASTAPQYPEVEGTVAAAEEHATRRNAKSEDGAS